MEVQRFKTKSGKETVLRSPTIGDVDALTEYINILSKEDTYITFSGEVISPVEEEQYVKDMLNGIAKGEKVALLCTIANKVVATCDIMRLTSSRKRGEHIGVFGITVAKPWRGEGIGLEIARVTIHEAKRNISGLQIIKLNVYEPNTTAQSLYTKLGFKEFGRLPKGVLYKGEYHDEIEMYLEI